ncbi:glycosyltransferase [Patescibacteria group bacterium]|nr:glycosyltransferase [Patescibacteria group bacterium]
MRVAIVHDDLVQWGGAERVLLGLLEIYPDASIYTSLFDRTNAALLRNFDSKKVITSFLQEVPGWKSLYKILLPFYPFAFEQFDFSKFDLVISHTTRFAKSIVTKPQTLHICYMHTPPRFLWHFSGEVSFGPAEILLTQMRIYDRVSSSRADFFLAGSGNARKRIKKVYNLESKVVYPFVDLERFKGIESFDGGYFAIVGRPNKYKRFDLAVSACLKLGVPLKVIGSSLNLSSLGKIKDSQRLISFLGSIDDDILVSVLAGCKALIIPGIEDFGLTSLEAQALGKPVVAYKAGGALETVIPGKTGILFDSQTTESLVDALKKLNTIKINQDDCRENAARFSKKIFIKNFKQTVVSLQ